MPTLPMLHVPTCHHVGSMDARMRKAASYEGQGLSVSTCPDAWQGIARLGGGLFEISRPDALFLDARALSPEVLDDVVSWSVENGLATQGDVWRLYGWDDERDEWTYGEFATREDALAQAEDPDEVEDVQAGSETVEMSGPSVVRMDGIVLTDAGADRLRGASREGDATDDLVILWAEDVLCPALPALCGVWWTDDYEPGALSAPRGVIFPDVVPTMQVVECRSWPQDEPDLPQETVVEMRNPVPYP